MRNIFILPNGVQQSFRYPDDRHISVGTPFQITLSDDSVHTLYVSAIEDDLVERCVFFHLKYQ
jgi:hypothetical protein